MILSVLACEKNASVTIEAKQHWWNPSRHLTHINAVAFVRRTCSAVSSQLAAGREGTQLGLFHVQCNDATPKCCQRQQRNTRTSWNNGHYNALYLFHGWIFIGLELSTTWTRFTLRHNVSVLLWLSSLLWSSLSIVAISYERHVTGEEYCGII